MYIYIITHPLCLNIIFLLKTAAHLYFFGARLNTLSECHLLAGAAWCAACPPGTFSAGGQSICTQCLQAAYSTAWGQSDCTVQATTTPAPDNSSVVPIFEFIVQYQLSEITADIQLKMSIAVAGVLLVSTSRVVLSFAEVDLRQRVLLQLKGVLVSVGLKDFQGSSAQFASQLTKGNVDSKMAALGLKSVQSVTISGMPGSTSF